MIVFIHEFVSFNTQPPEGGCCVRNRSSIAIVVSTHSRLKAAVGKKSHEPVHGLVSTHSRLKAAVEDGFADGEIDVFQHTAA